MPSSPIMDPTRSARPADLPRPDALKSTLIDASRPAGLALQREKPNAIARVACRYARTARGRLAAVYRLRTGTRDRPVQGRHRRFVPGAERPPGGKARRMAEPDRERAWRVQGAASAEEGRALRGQPDLPPFERPADEGHGNLREAQGACYHHLVAPADRNRRGRAFLWRRSFP